MLTEYFFQPLPAAGPAPAPAKKGEPLAKQPEIPYRPEFWAATSGRAARWLPLDMQ
ncbi:MAG: hypothetical protein WKG07_45465 [Hymenobacter sp.]